MKPKSKIVVIGGGTGSFTVLTGLKQHPVELTAVVTMADDGGSTGVLRDELGVLPPGDVRQCLVALSKSDELMRELINYRFPSGSLEGHSFGNLLLSALEKVTGSFEDAVEKASEILRIQGTVIPATLDKVQLVAHLANNREVVGQSTIHKTSLLELEHIELRPTARANPKAVRAIEKSDLVVVGPGDFYSSLIPSLLVDGIPAALQATRARILYVTNLMAKTGHTEQFHVEDFVTVIERYISRPVDHVLYNTYQPTARLLEKYARDGETMVDPKPTTDDARFIGADLVSRSFPKTRPGDPIERTYIRHDPTALAQAIIHLLS